MGGGDSLAGDRFSEVERIDGSDKKEKRKDTLSMCLIFGKKSKSIFHSALE